MRIVKLKIMNILKLVGSFFLGTLFWSCSTTEQTKLVNPYASKKAVNLYNFIQEIGGKYTLSGQHNYCGKGSEYKKPST